MKINLSKQEYADLLLMTAIAERVICTDNRLDEYTELQERVTKTCESFYAYADAFGMSDAVETYKGKLDLTEDYMQEVFRILEEYEEEYVFWETGAVLLARRDLFETCTKKEWESLDEVERMQRLFDLRMKYLSEWDKYGYSRLRIVEGKKKA